MKRFFIKNRDIILFSLLLLAILAVVFKDVIFSDHVFMKRDISRYYYPLRNFVGQTFKLGQVPLWNPYIFCGAPLHASIQNSVFYPFSIIYYLMDTAKGLSLFIILHILLAGLFTYIFMRYLRVSKEGCLLSAIAFSFSGYMMSAINLSITLASITWFPLAMLTFITGINKRSYISGIYLGIVLTLMLAAGDPSVIISTSAIIFLTCAYLFIKSVFKKIRPAFFILYPLCVFSVFLLLGAFQIIPAIEYFSQTTRSGMGWNESSGWSVPYVDLTSLVIPYLSDLNYFYYCGHWAKQVWLDNYYVGITVLILAGFSFTQLRQKRIVRFLIILGILSLSVSLGKYFIVYPALYKIVPFFKMLRYPVRFFYILTFSLCALSGIGYDRLKEMADTQSIRPIAKTFLITGFIAAVCVGALTLMGPLIAKAITEKFSLVYKGNPYFNINKLPSLVYADLFNLRRTLLYLCIMGLFIFFWSKTKRQRLMQFVVIFIVGADLLLTNTGFEPTDKESVYKEPTDNIRYVLEDKALFRILVSPYTAEKFNNLYEKSYTQGVRNAKDRFVNNRMMEFGIYDMWGYDSTTLRRNWQVADIIYKSQGPAQTRIPSMLNVKYIVAHNDMKAKGYEKAHSTENATLHRNRNALSRAFIAENVKIINKEQDILEYISSVKFNPLYEVVLEEDPCLSIEKRPVFSDKPSVSFIQYTPNIVDILVQIPAAGILVLSDTYFPGWKAYVNGSQTHIYRANYFIRAVKVPKGESIVRFIYDPLSFRLGLAITLATLLTIILYLVFFYLRLTKPPI